MFENEILYIVHTSPWKVCNEMKESKLELFIEGKDFIRLYKKTGWTDLDKLKFIDSQFNEGTNTVVTSDSGRQWWFYTCRCMNEN